jgi:hypothetical protein
MNGTDRKIDGNDVRLEREKAIWIIIRWVIGL